MSWEHYGDGFAYKNEAGGKLKKLESDAKKGGDAFVSIAWLKRSINCSISMLGKEFDTKYMGVPCQICFPCLPKDSAPTVGVQLVGPELMQNYCSKTISSPGKGWGEVYGPTFLGEVENARAFDDNSENSLSIFACVRAVLVVAPTLQNEDVCDVSSKVQAFVERFVDHSRVAVNHYWGNKSYRPGSSISVLSEETGAGSVINLSSPLYRSTRECYLDEQLLINIAKDIEQDLPIREEVRFIRYAQKDLYYGNFRSACLHAGLAVEIFIQVYLNGIFSKKFNEEYAKKILIDNKPSLGTIAGYFYTVTSATEAEYHKIVTLRNSAAHGNKTIKKEDADEIVKLSSQLIVRFQSDAENLKAYNIVA